jgi:sulfopyruvate decarboxylase subunit beta
MAVSLRDPVKRHEALRALRSAFSDSTLVCYAGAACEELYASGDEERFLYVLGSMGLSSSVGLGLALSGRRVVAVEGDGSILMNLGSLVTIGRYAPLDFILAIIDNGQHASTGGQPTATSVGADLGEIARAAGCRSVRTSRSEQQIAAAAEELVREPRPTVLVIKVEPGDGPRRLVDLAPDVIRDRTRRLGGWR